MCDCPMAERIDCPRRSAAAIRVEGRRDIPAKIGVRVLPTSNIIGVEFRRAFGSAWRFRSGGQQVAARVCHRGATFLESTGVRAVEIPRCPSFGNVSLSVIVRFGNRSDGGSGSGCCAYRTTAAVVVLCVRMAPPVDLLDDLTRRVVDVVGYHIGGIRSAIRIPYQVQNSAVIGQVAGECFVDLTNQPTVCAVV